MYLYFFLKRIFCCVQPFHSEKLHFWREMSLTVTCKYDFPHYLVNWRRCFLNCCCSVSGSEDVAKDFDLLSFHNITHIINCTQNVGNLFEDKITYLNIKIIDTQQVNIKKYFDQAFRFISDCINSGGNVSLN